MWAGLGCSALLLLFVISAIGVLAVTQLRGGEPTLTPTTTTETSTEETTSAAPYQITAEDKELAAQRFYDYLGYFGHYDLEAACELMVHPTTKVPYVQGEVFECISDLQQVDPSVGETFRTILRDYTVEDVLVEELPSGNLSITMYDRLFPYEMVRGEDGVWYVDFSPER